MKSLYYRVRGCSWRTRAQFCRLANRNDDEPGWRYVSLGFRVFQEYL